MIYSEVKSYSLVSKASVWDRFPDCRGKRVFLKPNLVTPPHPRFDHQSTTHVSVTKIAAELAIDGGADSVVIGECGFKNQWAKTMEFSGYLDAFRGNPKVELIALQDGENFHRFRLVRLNRGEYLSLYGVKFSEYLLECDFVINLPKLKMHSMSLVTGAIKNMMGTMAQKGSMHPCASSTILHKRLRDFYLLIKPMTAYCVMDGVIGSEYAEQYGVPVQSNLLLADEDPWQLDCAAASAMSVNPAEVPYLKMIKAQLRKDWPESVPLELRKEYERPLAWRRK